MTKQARTAILRLGKRPRSTEEMMEAIECLRTTRAEEQVQLCAPSTRADPHSSNDFGACAIVVLCFARNLALATDKGLNGSIQRETGARSNRSTERKDKRYTAASKKRSFVTIASQCWVNAEKRFRPSLLMSKSKTPVQ